jgi:hypothetical protein
MVAELLERSRKVDRFSPATNLERDEVRLRGRDRKGLRGFDDGAVSARTDIGEHLIHRVLRSC